MKSVGQGRFALLELLGSGGSASVYRAQDTVLGVERAIKVVEAGSGTSLALRRRLLGEARAMAQMSHPHILRIHDVVNGDGEDFIVMDLVRRGSLEDRLEREGPMPPAEAVQRVLEVLSALDAAHRANIVHRDVKPANILISADGRSLLADFGIARLPEDTSQRQTRAGSALGSLAFMPPEQRLDARNVGPTADIYAAGTTLYSLLTALNPIDLFLAEQDSPRWASVPEALRPILQRATSAAPEDRQSSVEMLAKELSAVLPSLGGTAPAMWPSLTVHATQTAPEGPTLTQGAFVPDKAPARRRLAVGAALAALLLFSAIALGWNQRAARDPQLAATTDPPGAVKDVSPTFTGGAPGSSAPISRPPPDQTLTTPVETAAPPVETPAPSTKVSSGAPTAAARSDTRTAPPRTPVAASFGAWTGTFGGRNAELRLDGSPNALRGELVVRASGRSVVSPVEGTWSGASGSLELHDLLETEDAGSYAARVSGDGTTVEGTFTRKNGVTVPMKLVGALR